MFFVQVQTVYGLSYGIQTWYDLCMAYMLLVPVTLYKVTVDEQRKTIFKLWQPDLWQVMHDIYNVHLDDPDFENICKAHPCLMLFL